MAEGSNVGSKLKAEEAPTGVRERGSSSEREKIPTEFAKGTEREYVERKIETKLVGENLCRKNPTIADYFGCVLLSASRFFSSLESVWSPIFRYAPLDIGVYRIVENRSANSSSRR